MSSTGACTPPAYVLIRQARHIEALFNVYRQASAINDTVTCRAVAQFFKRLVSISQNPDIILTLINDDHYQDFFAALGHLEENACISDNFRRYFSEHSRFNNYLGIDNPEILANINNNFRITFLKEFIFPTFLTDKQLEELNTFLFLHNNTIVCHINSIMDEQMRDLDLQLEKDPSASHEFFGELFAILKVTIGGLKATFVQKFVDLGLLEKVALLLEKTAIDSLVGEGKEAVEEVQKPELVRGPLEVSGRCEPFQSSIETQKRSPEKMLAVCSDILSFMSRNSQRAFLKLLQTPLQTAPTFLEFIPRFLEIPITTFAEKWVELFACQQPGKVEDADPSYPQYLATTAIPFLATTVKSAQPPNTLPLLRRKTLCFVAEVFNTFFQFQGADVKDSLIRNSILKEVYEEIRICRNKAHLLILLRYFRETIANDKPATSDQNWRRAFDCLWSCYDRHSKRRVNQLHSLILLIFRQVCKSDNLKLLRKFARVARRQPTHAQQEEEVAACLARLEELKLKMQGANLELTSESESSLTQEQNKRKVTESFLEGKFWSAEERLRTGGNSPSFLTPKESLTKDPMHELLSRMGTQRQLSADEFEVACPKSQGTAANGHVRVAIDDSLLGRRSTPESKDP